MKKLSKIQKAIEIKKILDQRYPEPKCSLDYASPFELLIATILSAQCTDARVNMVTPKLFAKYPMAKDLAMAKLDDVANILHPLGFYNTKAKNIIACAQGLVELYGGEVPMGIEKLTRLGGVGRKTANLIMGDIFGAPSYVVDTHCSRIVKRLGLVEKSIKSADIIEKKLREVVPEGISTDFCHMMVHFGRDVCNARKPKCDECELKELCDEIIHNS
ncbi:MAG: endonuclease III [Clostridiales bacterium]|jgi:endonuclease-3|nr:endonuclease III [Clostridiales bacterium]